MWAFPTHGYYWKALEEGRDIDRSFECKMKKMKIGVCIKRGKFGVRDLFRNGHHFWLTRLFSFFLFFLIIPSSIFFSVFYFGIGLSPSKYFNMFFNFLFSISSSLILFPFFFLYFYFQLLSFTFFFLSLLSFFSRLSY